MASLRGSEVLWDAETVDANSASDYAVAGPGPYVAIYIDNGGSSDATFKVQASASPVTNPGLNALDSDDFGGGLTWYNYSGATSLSVPASSSLCFDLAPFSPPFVRLVRTDSGSGTITAIISCFGPN